MRKMWAIGWTVICIGCVEADDRRSSNPMDGITTEQSDSVADIQSAEDANAISLPEENVEAIDVSSPPKDTWRENAKEPGDAGSGTGKDGEPSPTDASTIDAGDAVTASDIDVGDAVTASNTDTENVGPQDTEKTPETLDSVVDSFPTESDASPASNDADISPASDDIDGEEDSDQSEMDTEIMEGGEGPFSCTSCSTSGVSAQWDLQQESWTLPPDRTRNNPLKGFMTSYLWGQPANDFPDQMEFVYLPMAEVWGPEGPLFETGIEPHLEAAASRGHHLLLRIYVDYPNKPYGLPPYLEGTVTCQLYSEHGGGCSPDYDHPEMLAAMVDLMTAMGAQYDGDPRLGAIQVGLLGFWGEWHTYPHTSWFPSENTQTALLNAVHNAFSVTQVQVRKPMANSSVLAMGYHDDSFAHSTLGDIDWFFWPQILNGGEGQKWETAMMGGELRPELQGTCFTETYTLETYAQDVIECIETTHVSYMLNYKAFNKDGVGYTGEERVKAEAAARRMGYQFELEGGSLELSKLDGDMVDTMVTIQLKQTGIAPFYYDLFASLLGEDGTLIANHTTNLKTLLPGDTLELEFTLGERTVTEVLAPMQIHLNSPLLQPMQHLLIATRTDQTAPQEPTKIQWQVQCETPYGKVIPGQIVEGNDGCPCRCDVDGSLYDCDGIPCL